MGVDVRPSVLVRRSRAEVAGFMFEPANDLRWTGGITSSRPAQDGPLATGSTVERTARFLCRTFTYGYVVTGFETDRLVDMMVERPFPMRVRYELSDAEGGTMVAIHAAGTPGRYFGWASPLMTRQVRKNITADLQRLRRRLEDGDPGVSPRDQPGGSWGPVSGVKSIPIGTAPSRQLAGLVLALWRGTYVSATDAWPTFQQ